MPPSWRRVQHRPALGIRGPAGATAHLGMLSQPVDTLASSVQRLGMLLNILEYKGPSPQQRLLHPKCHIAEVHTSCSGERAGGSEVKGPLESTYKIRVRRDVREAGAFTKLSKSRDSSEACPRVSERLPGLLNLAAKAAGVQVPIGGSGGRSNTQSGRHTWTLSREPVL